MLMPSTKTFSLYQQSFSVEEVLSWPGNYKKYRGHTMLQTSTLPFTWKGNVKSCQNISTMHINFMILKLLERVGGSANTNNKFSDI